MSPMESWTLVLVAVAVVWAAMRVARDVRRAHVERQARLDARVRRYGRPYDHERPWR